jgi:homoserine O-acetyltransferase
MSEPEIACKTYGELAPARDNVILDAHGTNSSHHATGPPTADRRRGRWSGLIGSGKLFDTRRYCVVSSNVLGS